ncbi:hypothetical protein BDP27DRAFT_1427086 [Rhodocollybia butyracea]|uniref:Uncharacterized protein n=1 Tax=Rhodocollybia butyracea TaxID=206335 RepID=A0A9P5U293_9AGAR|nr:hypothetical protein BDP27DRAFT_1427086 [Rhodocollybia butyracea]
MLLLITSLTSSSNAEKVEPIEDFRLFEMRVQARSFQRPGEIDVNSSLNTVSVRGDIARLLNKEVLTLVPSKEVIDVMKELTLYDKHSKSVSDRRRCFEVCRIDLTARTRRAEKKIPLFAFDSSGNVQQFDYPYSDIPPFTLDCYPLHTVMHSCYALPRQCESEARAIDECHSDIFILAHRWRFPYPETGSFTLPPEVAAQKAADRASVQAAYGLLGR